MKISKRELLNFKDSIHKVFNKDVIIIEDNPFIRSLKDLDADIEIYYDVMDDLWVDVKLEVTMVCPCAITLEDVEVPLMIDDSYKLSFIDEEDSYFIENELDIESFIKTIVLPEVPIKVVKNDKIDYPKGEGWQVLTEESLREEKANEIDPRLAKLKEYKFEEE